MSDITRIAASLDGIEGAFKAIRDAEAALDDLEVKLVAQNTGTKTLADVLKQISMRLGAIWHSEQLYGPTNSERKTQVRKALTEAERLTKALEPSPSGVRRDISQTVHRF